ncbi:MAG: transcription termination factor NusA [Dehalococcoidia bacterium]
MKSDFLIALTQLAAERNLPRDKVMGAIEAALVSAFKKDSVTEGHNISVRLDPGSGDIEVDIVKTVVDTVEDPLQELTKEEARANYNPTADVGDVIKTQNIPNSAGRIAAQTAKQVVLQRLREAEREIVLAEYEGREGEIITVTIQRIEPNKIIVDTGRTEAILPVSQQVSSERYRQGSKIKVLLQAIDKESIRGPELIVSRADEILLRRLFEQEVPEIYNGAVEIVGIARESGSRSKVAVRAKQDGVDPVGSCVGLRGVRIQSIVNELQGEKIDILEWNKDPNRYIQNALSPSEVLRVDVDQDNSTAVAIVPNRHLSLAIGKEGQNARLAAKLCGWAVDIKSDMDVDLTALENRKPVAEVAEEVAKEVVKKSLTDEELYQLIEGNLTTANPIEDEEKSEEQTVPGQQTVIAETNNVEQELQEILQPDTEVEKESDEAPLTAEEELLLFEMEEEERAKKDETEETAASISELPEDIWSIHRSGARSPQAGAIRFAEDIDELRGGVTGRRERRGSGRNQSNRKGPGSTKKRR